ncbi:hypothetical protein [Kitasatospora sp. NBC_01300]|uniref:hypothetical protein n=1 Tax=Kitasatospora sp. NBC_01300 TaxID=2903574 RepID=UPI002F908565|nr:hypothetical protein OG556_40340 [Kitasatospora sp. NBC_01300]
MASNHGPSPKVGTHKTTNHGDGGSDPQWRTATETALVARFSPFEKHRTDSRYVCRSGRYPDGKTPDGPVPRPERAPARTTPLHACPPVRRRQGPGRPDQQAAA